MLFFSLLFKHFNVLIEARHTFDLGKKYIPLIVQKRYRPDGWLGPILGTKQYFDFSKNFELAWNDLKCTELFSMLKNSPEGKYSTFVILSQVQRAHS